MEKTLIELIMDKKELEKQVEASAKQTNQLRKRLRTLNKIIAANVSNNLLGDAAVKNDDADYGWQVLDFDQLKKNAG